MVIPNDIESLKDLVILLLSRLDQSDSVLAALRIENAALKGENADLRSRLNMHSGNNSKPPSSDGLAKKPAFHNQKDKKAAVNWVIQVKRLKWLPHLTMF